MRLRVHFTAANEELIQLVNEGYDALSRIEKEYPRRKTSGAYDDSKDVQAFVAPMDVWVNKVVAALEKIFPTQLETNLFLDPEIPLCAVSGDYVYQSTILRYSHIVRGLNKLRHNSLPEYTDLPLDVRLYVEDIDSFKKVRDVNPGTVLNVLKDGYLDVSEDRVQMAFERILAVPFHKKDWGGEQNDLYTANLVVNGARHETAFMLKGNGLKRKVMEMKDCGKNGDQILRLCGSPARLFVIQFVGTVSEAVVSDVDGKVRNLRTHGKDAWYCIIDGHDNARVLRAYGEL